MKKWSIISCISLLVFSLLSFVQIDEAGNKLRKIYSGPPSSWPAPLIEPGVQWNELAVLPPGPLAGKEDSLKHVIDLGKMLFFDTRLSGSGTISCGSCHQPELSWADGKVKSTGHQGAINKRNSPSLQNVWFYDKLFWDGRSKDLQDQAFAPINSETEMHSDMPDVMRQLRKITAYKEYFKKAFGDEEISPDRMTEAIATFEKTIVSAKTKFDRFLEGDTKALSISELKGLHLFRTKAGCMNCHNGSLFTDNKFHNNGFFYKPHYEKDKGLYMVTHKDQDLGKYKTPSLRSVTLTGPWMHDGSQDKLLDILVIYSKGGLESADSLITPRTLSKRETRDLIAFLGAISSPPIEFSKPSIPE
jgi:cytochrome c peroxidase